MTRVVISERFGGFGLSDEGTREYLRRTGREWTERPGMFGISSFKVTGDPEWYQREIPRDDPVLIAVVTDMGEAASSRFADLVVVEVPDGVEWHVHEYDGYESVHTAHQTITSSGTEDGC